MGSVSSPPVDGGDHPPRSREPRRPGQKGHPARGTEGSRQILIASSRDFARVAAVRIAWALQDAGDGGEPISLVLTGSTATRPVYVALAELPGVPWDNVDLFFGDERAVPPDHPDSRYRMVRETLLDRIPLPRGRVHRMEAERADLDRVARDYEDLLPERVSLLVLGVGADGDAASFFPGPSDRVGTRRVVLATAPSEQEVRMTITPRVVQAADHVLVVVRGSENGAAVRKALSGDADPSRCPAALARNGIWVLDTEAASGLGPGPHS